MGENRPAHALGVFGVALKVLLISKALVSGPYQKKLEELAREPDIELRAVTPPYWRTGKTRQRLSRLHVDGYELRVRRALLNGRFHVHFFPGLGREIDDFRPDLVHVDEEPYNLATAHAIGLARRANARCLFFAWQNLNRRYRPPFMWFERYSYRNAAAIAGTQAALDVLLAKGFIGPAAVIPQFGVDPEMFRPSTLDKEDGPFTVGFVGRLVESKGLRTLLPAFERLGGRERLSIAGDGPLAEWVRQYAVARGFGNRLELAGHMPPEDIPAFLSSVDVLVLPSIPTSRWVEQFGRSLIEAMASEVPVIGSKSGEIPNVIGDAGVLVPPGDVNALAAALAGMRDDALRRRTLGKKGRKRVLAQFTHSRIAAATARFYRTLVQ